MTLYKSACISFSDITIRFEFPDPVRLNKDFLDFLCEDTMQPDETIRFELLTAPLTYEGTEVFRNSFNSIYRTDKGWLRIYTPLTAADGCQVACLFCPDGNEHIFYFPASKWHQQEELMRCLHMICAEQIMLQHNAFLLHSSVVLSHGKMILFSGPSGAGKSTQADLWAKHTGAEVINGDRCVILKRDGLFYGSGSPWSGTSRIHRREQAPIAGIFLVCKASENSLQRLYGMEAFAPLFSQTLVNSWDREFMTSLTALYVELLSQVPVWRLNCRADADSVQLVYQTLF